MSIEREYGRYIPACDGCGAALETEDNFQDAVDAKRNAGWRSRKYGDEWTDLCPVCQVAEVQP